MDTPWRVTQVRALDDCCSIRVYFTDGLEGVVRFPPEFFKGVFSHLSDPSRFKEVAVVNGAVTWPGGLDLAPDAMYEDIQQQVGRLPGKATTISTRGYRFDRDDANARTKETK
jgi:hypothetical protein